MPSHVLQELLEAVASGEDFKAEAAALALAANGEQILPAIWQMLENLDPEIRWWGVRVLAEINSPASRSMILDALRNDNQPVRQCAALALNKQPSIEAIPELVRLLSDEDRLLARLAADALIANGEAAVPALLEVMENGHRLARLEAVRALAKIGDTRAIPALYATLDEDSAMMEYWAGQGLERMGVGMMFFKP